MSEDKANEEWREGTCSACGKPKKVRVFADRSSDPLCPDCYFGPQPTPQPQTAKRAPKRAMPHRAYAGFWMRFGALMIDVLLLTFVFPVLFLVLAPLIQRLATPHADNRWLLYVFGVPFVSLYYTIMECSSLQATFGKNLAGIVVTDLRHKRLSFGRALARNIARWLSHLPINIGFLLAGVTPKKQALHDMVAGTLVVMRPRKKPAEQAVRNSSSRTDLKPNNESR